MEQVQKTSDYSIFKSLDGNRKIDKYHLRKLKESIEKNNRLNLHPVIVNKDFEVIDGQHRLEVAKMLGLEIFYIQSDSINHEHLIECNVNQKSWEVENYIDFFSIKEKISDYVELQQMMKMTKLKPKALMTLALGNVSKKILEFLKTGKFRFPQNKDFQRFILSYCDFIAYVEDKRIKPLSMFSNHYFSKAFRWLLSTSGFDFTAFLKKLDLRWFDLKPQRGAEEWYKLLISIYNFKNHNRIEEQYALDSKRL